MYVCIYTYVYIYIYNMSYIYIYIYIYTHTYARAAFAPDQALLHGTPSSACWAANRPSISVTRLAGGGEYIYIYIYI